MRIVKFNKTTCLLEADKKDETSRSFVFSLKIIPDKPRPKSLEIFIKYGKRIKTWHMSWAKFLKQSCIDDIAIINKDEFKFSYKSNKASKVSNGTKRKI